MLIIPAIDLRRGYCVRLLRGDPSKETIYSEDPSRVACEWERLGAKYLHLVDLDGAFSGQTANAAAVERIASEIKVPFQLGGGMRTRQALEDAFALGVTRAIIGTMAVEDPELLKELLKEYGDRIVVGLDARDGMVSVKGWAEDTEIKAEELARQLESYGLKEIIYTDINRDGTLLGPNIDGIKKMAAATGLSLIASGGITRISELKELKSIQEECRIRGAIIGKALYSGRLTLTDALDAVQ